MSEVASTSGRFKLENESIVFDVIDGETVIMNLGRGTYYALNASAGLLWQLLLRRMDLAEISAVLANSGLSVNDEDLRGFTANLVDLGLIAMAEDESPHEGSQGQAISLPTWDLPRITEYSDMKDLLAMDPPLPVHQPE